MNTSVIPGVASRGATARYLYCLRLRLLEVVVLQGSPLLGAAVAFRRPTTEQLGPLAILVSANICLVAHIFVINDWSNLTADRTDPNRAGDVFTVRGVRANEMLTLAAGLLVASLLLFDLLGLTTLSIALGIAALSTLYSVRPFNWKGRPLLNSVAHLTGGVLHFLLGYSLGHALDGRGFAIATFFALTFAAGHLTQEIRDHDSDVRNAIMTNAVAFGRRRTFVASLALFTLSQALLIFLALQGTLPRALAALAVVYPIHLRWSLQALAQGLDYASICRLQARYRALYAVIGLALLGTLWVG